MAKPGSKRQAAIDIINRMCDSDVDDVITAIVQEVGLARGEARAYFRHLTKVGLARHNTVEADELQPKKRLADELQPKKQRVVEPIDDPALPPLDASVKAIKDGVEEFLAWKSSSTPSGYQMAPEEETYIEEFKREYMAMFAGCAG